MPKKSQADGAFHFFDLAAGEEAGVAGNAPVAPAGLRLYLAMIGAKSAWVRPYSVILLTKSSINGPLFW